jgi:hypothetical protein
VINVNVRDTSAYTLAASLHTAEDVPAAVQHHRDPNNRSRRASLLLKQGALQRRMHSRSAFLASRSCSRRNNRPAGAANCDA